jgi:BNR/Asp-box repeat
MLSRLVNLIPRSLSGEANQDSEPNIAVNPAQPAEMVATAFTPDPLHGRNAPIYVSSDAGQTWSLRAVVPGNGPFGTGDISVGFATTGGVLYVGILSSDAPPSQTRLQILRTASFISTATMPVLVDRLGVDQPWVVAGTVRAGPARGRDRVYVANNDLAAPGGRTATVDVSLNAATGAAPGGFHARRVERGKTEGQDGPPVRVALHPDGTVYAVHQRWTAATGNSITMDVVVSRDDDWAASAAPFSTLKDSHDGSIGQRVVTGRNVIWNATMGQERLGADSAIAVDPRDSDVVWVAWGEGGGPARRWTLHVRRSTDRGQTWSPDLRKVVRGKNPCLAVNGDGLLGFSCQQLKGVGATQRWVTSFEVTADGWTSPVAPTVLHTALAARPAHTFLPYLGDYARVICVGQDFYGVFSGSNHPDQDNFPSGVTYQRNVDWKVHTLLDIDGTTPVPDSIDPFFFHWSG